VGVEYKLDVRDGRYKLMEINPRTVSANELAIRAGVDFPWIVYQYLNAGGEEQRPRPTRGFRLGVKYVNEEWDIGAYLALRRAGELTLREWWASVRGAEARALGSWRDPRPLMVALWRVLRTSLRKALAGRPRRDATTATR
jgi:predicted ATP-grasp superfamily ATP-dependent carboligase